MFIYYANTTARTHHTAALDDAKILAKANIIRNSLQINLSGLATGMYFLKVSGPWGTRRKRVVVR